jgi:hypothetical protein
MTIQEMYDTALAVIKEHNSIVGEGHSGYINQDKFLVNVKASGGTTLDRLKALSYEDILACMPVIVGLEAVKPIAIAKDIAKIFRGKEETKIEDMNHHKVFSAKKADKMTLLELVQNYDPEEDNAVSKRLKDISRNEPFIVFSSGRTVNVDLTLKLLQEVKQGYEGRKSTDVNGEPQEVYTIGSLPDNFVEENPLYRNRPLRPDGTCDQTGRSWNGVPTNVRQLIRLAIETNELEVSIDKANDVLDLVMADEPWKKLVSRYRKAAIEFKKLDGMGKLPLLKLVLSKGGCESKNPFQQARK